VPGFRPRSTSLAANGLLAQLDRQGQANRAATDNQDIEVAHAVSPPTQSVRERRPRFPGIVLALS